MPELRLPCRRGCAAVLLLLSGLTLAQAQGQAEPASRIQLVELYPGSAIVERALAVRPGSEQAQFACLPAGLDAGQLQARGSDGVQVGEISVREQPRSLLGELCRDPLDERIDEVLEQRAAHEAEIAATDYAIGFLKSFEQGGQGNAELSPEQIAAAAQALHQSGLQWQRDRHALARKVQRLDETLEQLRAERDRSGGADAPRSVVRVLLYAPMGGQVALRYPVHGPSWQPAYRAELDTDADRLRLTRLARVVQNSGEDWTNVPITLSTGQPGAATTGPLPRPWRLDLEDGKEQGDTPVLRKSAAPVASMAAEEMAGDAAGARFDMAVVDAAFATEFRPSQPVTVPTGGETVTLTLGEQELPARWLVRAAPALDPHAYLVARLDQPLQGVWPAGPVALYRDGTLVGRGHLDLDQVARDGLAFGRDERVRVRTEHPERRRGTRGLMGGRNQRIDERRYRVENAHEQAVEVQVLDAAPISQNDKIKVESEYQPQVQPDFWQDRHGTVFWQQELAAGAVEEFVAKHTITWPRDEQLRER